jgi:uncharacterized damage-inducible protein DinB
MAQQTMNAIDAFRQSFEDEYQRTRRALQAYPPDKASMKPGEKLRTAQELAWMMTLNQMVPVPILEMNELTGSGLPNAPATWKDVMAAFEQAHKDTSARLSKVTDAEWNSELRLPVAPKQMGPVKRGDALWMFLHDSIHHRGQFTVYLRLAGAKVPSIYGPTADESWS